MTFALRRMFTIVDAARRVEGTGTSAETSRSHHPLAK
jgi:hypothetical protein